MYTNYCKIVKLLKSFKLIIVAPTCFGLHKPSSGSSQPVLRQSYSVDIGYILLFEVIGIVAAHADLPDDGLCKPKRVGATIIILNDFNCLTIL
jgi:hypothetical protein